LVNEKRHLDLIKAYTASNVEGFKLVIVGDSDHPDQYVEQVRSEAGSTDGVVMTGFQTGQPLQALFQHAALFVLPSSHEGLPIALLEALSYGLPVVASDIPANIEVGLSEEHYFPLGDIEKLADRLKWWTCRELTEADRESRRAWVSKRYNWKDIAASTYKQYREVAGTLFFPR